MPEGEGGPSIFLGPLAREFSQEEQRMRCFQLGAQVHDHVEDMMSALEEVDEAKDEALGRDARQWFNDLNRMLGREVDAARAQGCLPSDVAALYDEAARFRPEDPTLRRALYALSVRLGDPPVLRNIRRYEQLGSRPATETKR